MKKVRRKTKIRSYLNGNWLGRMGSVAVQLPAVVAQRALAASLLDPPLAGECNVAGVEPELHEVFEDVRSQRPAPSSRQGPCLPCGRTQEPAKKRF